MLLFDLICSMHCSFCSPKHWLFKSCLLSLLDDAKCSSPFLSQKWSDTRVITAILSTHWFLVSWRIDFNVSWSSSGFYLDYKIEGFVSLYLMKVITTDSSFLGQSITRVVKVLYGMKVRFLYDSNLEIHWSVNFYF